MLRLGAVLVAWVVRSNSANMVGSTMVRRGGVGCRLLVHDADGEGWHVAHLKQPWRQRRFTTYAAAVVLSRLGW
jgi:hypothetical protein